MCLVLMYVTNEHVDMITQPVSCILQHVARPLAHATLLPEVCMIVCSVLNGSSNVVVTTPAAPAATPTSFGLPESISSFLIRPRMMCRSLGRVLVW